MTRNTYTGNGVTTDFTFSFPYLSQSHVLATINGVATTAFTFFSSSTLRFTTAPANGAAVVIYRSTPNSTLLADFTAGSAIREQDLELDLQQNLYASQELKTFVEQQSTAGLQEQITAATNTANLALTVANTQVTFTQTGVGAVGRTVTSKLAESVSVKDFGAVGDGFTDDTAAINAAINSLAPYGQYFDGATVFFPQGLYRTTSSINLAGKHGLTLSGSGVNSTQIILDTGVNAPVFISDNSAGPYSVPWNAGCISNMTIRGGGNGLSNSHGISVNFANGCIYENLAIYSCADGMRMFNAFQGWINKVEFKGAGTDRCNNGLYFGETALINGYYNNALSVSDVNAYNCISNGFRIINGQGSKFTSCEAGGCNVGWNIGNPTTGTAPCQWLQVVNCLSDTSSTVGWKLVKGSASQFSQMVFSGCWGGSAPTLLELSGATDILFDGLLLVQCDSGITFNGCSQINISGLRLINYNQNNNSTRGLLVNNSSNNIIEGSATSSWPFTNGDFAETGTSNANTFSFLNSNTGTLLGSSSRGETNDSEYSASAFSKVFRTLSDNSSITTYQNTNGAWNLGILGSASSNAFTFNYGASVVAQLLSTSFNLNAGIELRFGQVIVKSGTGSPQGVVAAPVGSMFLRTDAGTGTTFYIKETGTNTNTGWVAK